MRIGTDYNVPKAYTYNPNFKRNWAEHVSWGANFVKETGKANFKMFTFKDAKNVFVELAKDSGRKFGNIKDRIVKLLFIQGAAFGLGEVSTQDDATTIYPMNNKGDGVFEVDNIDTKENSSYRFIVQTQDGKFNIVKDAYAKKQPDINGWSEIYDPNGYDWRNTAWNDSPNRIVRKPNEPMRGLENLIIEEVNIPTLSQEGTFEKARAHIDDIVDRGIATAIEIMPVENTFSLQWGYDGVDKFAVNEKMGDPNKLKELIDYIHGRGLNVIMDMVPNHVGPDGCDLKESGPYLKGPNAFGNAINYEGKDNRYVRDWMTNAALWWVNEFKVDGLRLDMTKFCDSDYLLKQIVAEVNHHNPQTFIIAEDGRENQASVTAYQVQPMTHENMLEMIDQSVDNIATKGWMTYPDNIGFDSEWDFPFMHELKDAVIMPRYLNLDRLDEKIRNSQHRVKFVMSHDEIGNCDGTRLIPKIVASEMGLFYKVDGNSDAEKGQRTAHIAQKLTELYATGKLEQMSPEELHRMAKEMGLNDRKHISASGFERAFNIAKAKQKLAFATVMTIPGPKMYFQGDDDMKLSYFKFFREFSSDEYRRANDPNYLKSILAEKGYDTLEKFARPQSVIGSVIPSDNTYSVQMLNFSKDLSKLVKSSDALLKGNIINTYKDTVHKVHTHHLKYGDEEILVLKHFGEEFHSDSYYITGFPEGNWQEIFNSDKKEYGGFNFVNTGKLINSSSQDLNLAPNSVVILKKV